MKRFALTGAAGYIAPRHLKAIKETGNSLVAGVDPHDSVGILDSYFPDVAFFTEYERFDRHLEKLRRGPEANRVDYVSICSPNHLHDAHVRQALRCGADAICEKPLVLNPWNLDALSDAEREAGKKVWTILQLRVHPALLELHEKMAGTRGRHKVRLTYITSRGPWYRYSWKGVEQKSGGIATNIGIHFFDLVLWFFGSVRRSEVHLSEPSRMAGYLDLERADVEWYLSIEAADLPFQPEAGNRTTYRLITIDDHEVEFTGGFTDLHTRVYERTLAGAGFGIEDARPSITLVHDIRHAQVVEPSAVCHEMLPR